MRKTNVLILLIVIAVASAAGGFWFGTHRRAADLAEHDDTAAPATQPAEEDKPVAQVTTAPIRKAAISENVTAYGSVVAPPGSLRILSAPFESRVVGVVVSAGQHVEAGAEVVQIEASPDALLALTEAKNAVAAAENDLKQTQQRFADRLATTTEQSQAEQALVSAKLKLESLTQRGVGTSQTLKAGSAGIVGKVDVQEGQIVPAGGPLVEIAAGNSIEVALGVEPGDIAFLKPDQDVEITMETPSHGEPAHGRIRLIGQRVDLATRLISVMVTLPPDAHSMLDSYASGKFVKASADALVVPSTAVLPEDEGKFTLYTVRNRVAVKHTVRVGLQDDHDVQVIADDLKEGDAVVVTGNYELEEGMAVESKAATTEPATSQAVTAEAAKPQAATEETATSAPTNHAASQPIPATEASP